MDGGKNRKREIGKTENREIGIDLKTGTFEQLNN